MFEFKPKDLHPIFKDNQLQIELEEKGYVIVPFYNKNDIQLISNFYSKNTNTNNSGFQPTTYFDSLSYRLKASDFIKEVAKKYIDKYLMDYKAFMGSFIAKHADKNSELGVHQDMSLVDESKFMGVNIWAPLCDTNEKNGALFLIPKSHRLFPTYRNANITNIYDKHYHLIKKYMQPVFIKAGEAIIFDNSILHYSPANKSSQIRIATNVFVTHQEARITIYYHNQENNKIESFEQEDDFFTKYTQFGNDSNMHRPEIGKSLGFTDYNFPTLTPEIMKLNYGNLSENSFWEKIKKIF